MLQSVSRLLPSRARAWPVLVSIAASVALLGVAAVLSLDSRQVTGERARESVTNLARVMERDIARNIEMLSLSLQAVVEGVGRPDVMALPADLQRLVLFDRSATATNLGVLVVYDSNGVLAIDTASETPRSITPVVDREFFQALRDHDVGLYISKPYVSRLLNVPVIGLSRRLTHPDGSFAGIAHATIQLSYFKDLFAGLELGPDGIVSLSRIDGTMIARYAAGGRFDTTGDLSRSPTFDRMRREKAGSLTATSGIDGIERLYGFRRVGDLPLQISVGLSNRGVYAAWQQKASIAAVALTVICGVLVILTVLLTRELERRARAERKLVAANDELERLALTDALTRIGNRRAFDESIQREARKSLKVEQPLTLVMLDVDYFKRFNDSYGHIKGDEALIAISRVLSAAALAGGGAAYRVGGEEFSLLLPGKTMAFGLRLTEAIRREVKARAIPHAGSPFGLVTVSLGLSEVGDEPVAAAVERCDFALYDAKRQGRDRSVMRDSVLRAA